MTEPRCRLCADTGTVWAGTTSAPAMVAGVPVVTTAGGYRPCDCQATPRASQHSTMAAVARAGLPSGTGAAEAIDVLAAQLAAERERSRKLVETLRGDLLVLGHSGMCSAILDGEGCDCWRSHIEAALAEYEEHGDSERGEP